MSSSARVDEIIPRLELLLTYHHTYLQHQSTMARRRKNRTHLKGGTASAPGTQEGVPKSFVIKHGQVGTSLAQLVRDVRKVMEPNTASRLRVSFLLLFYSKTE